jgi:hypothetical protein
MAKKERVWKWLKEKWIKHIKNINKMFSTWDVRPLWEKHKLNCVTYVILNTIQKEKTWDDVHFS